MAFLRGKVKVFNAEKRDKEIRRGRNKSQRKLLFSCSLRLASPGLTL